jgi:hypothetical protein
MRPTMSKLLLVIGAAVIGSLILPAAFWIGSLVLPPIQLAVPVEWRWSDEKASLDYCIKQHMPDYDVELVHEDNYTPINIRTKDGKRLVYHLEDGHEKIAFARHKATLFIAEFSYMCTGCEVVAIDLATGKERWRSRLEGNPPGFHSKYHNSVNIETDGEKIIVYGTSRKADTSNIWT